MVPIGCLYPILILAEPQLPPACFPRWENQSFLGLFFCQRNSQDSNVWHNDEVLCAHNYSSWGDLGSLQLGFVPEFITASTDALGRCPKIACLANFFHLMYSCCFKILKIQHVGHNISLCNTMTHFLYHFEHILLARQTNTKISKLCLVVFVAAFLTTNNKLCCPTQSWSIPNFIFKVK